MALRRADRAIILESGVAVLDGMAEELRWRCDLKAFYLGRSLGLADRPAA